MERFKVDLRGEMRMKRGIDAKNVTFSLNRHLTIPKYKIKVGTIYANMNKVGKRLRVLK